MLQPPWLKDHQRTLKQVPAAAMAAAAVTMSLAKLRLRLISADLAQLRALTALVIYMMLLVTLTLCIFLDHSDSLCALHFSYPPKTQKMIPSVGILTSIYVYLLAPQVMRKTSQPAILSRCDCVEWQLVVLHLC